MHSRTWRRSAAEAQRARERWREGHPVIFWEKLKPLRVHGMIHILKQLFWLQGGAHVERQTCKQ